MCRDSITKTACYLIQIAVPELFQEHGKNSIDAKARKYSTSKPYQPKTIFPYCHVNITAAG